MLHLVSFPIFYECNITCHQSKHFVDLQCSTRPEVRVGELNHFTFLPKCIIVHKESRSHDAKAGQTNSSFSTLHSDHLSTDGGAMETGTECRTPVLEMVCACVSVYECVLMRERQRK